jgi:hypothetical protein
MDIFDSVGNPIFSHSNYNLKRKFYLFSGKNEIFRGKIGKKRITA